MTVYDYVKVLASEKNVDIKTVERACGFGNGTISKWSKSTPKADVIFKVAQYFNTPIEYFLTGIRPASDPQEKIVVDAFRATDTEGKARIIQISLNERDRGEKKNTHENSISGS